MRWRSALVIVILLPHLFIFLFVATPSSVVALGPDRQCAPFSLSPVLEALFGHDTDLSSRHCAAAYDDAPLWASAAAEQSLRWEMEHWIRANRSVGMLPEAYAFVWKEVMRLTNGLRGGGADGADGAQTNGTARLREMDMYASRANATLRAMPWLLATNETLAAAWRRHGEVRRRHIVRSFHISAEAGSPLAIRACLKRVAKWWAEAERRVARDLRVPAPLLPWISVPMILGPPFDPADAESVGNETFHHVDSRNRTGSAAVSVKRPMPRYTFRFLPSRLPLPSAVVFYYTTHCPSCDAVGAAFDLLPMIYRRLCEYGHLSIVSCSPLVLFFRAVAGPSQLFVPSLSIHGVPKQPVPFVSPFPSPLLDLDELLNMEDAFDGMDVPLGSDRHVVDVLHAILRRMVRYGLVEPRFLSPEEVKEIEWEERAAAAEEEKQEKEAEEEKEEQSGNASSGNSTENATGNLENTTTSNATKGRRPRGRVVSLDDHLRDVLAFHLVEVWGNASTQEDANNSATQLLEPMWFQSLCLALTALWVALLMGSYC